MTDRRGYDPKAPNGGAVVPQDEPNAADEQTVEETPGGAPDGQETPESVESDLEQPEPLESDVPELAEDVVAWVGDDPQRARLALEAEAARAKPRKTVTALESLLEETG